MFMTIPIRIVPFWLLLFSFLSFASSNNNLRRRSLSSSSSSSSSVAATTSNNNKRSHRYLKGKSNDDDDDEESSTLTTNYALDKKLRIVSFGTSRTWGAGLSSPSTESFPALLGGKNYAIRASDSNYPAMCTYSMITENTNTYSADTIVDVITIEYMPMSFYGTRNSLLHLGKRLRQRYPDALIIFLNVWTPHQFSHKPTSKGLRQYIKDSSLSDEYGDFHTWENLEMILNETQSEDWEFYDFHQDWLHDAANDPSINGTVLSLKLPSASNNTIDSILRVAPLYFHDFSHWSAEGHQWVADHINYILQEQNKVPSNNVNEWDSIDTCVSWFDSTKSNSKNLSPQQILSNSHIETNLIMHEFSKGKFALQLHYSGGENSEDEVNYIRINNTNSHSQYLYISHMASGPQEYYPTVMAEIFYASSEQELRQQKKQDSVGSGTPIITWYADTPPQLPIHVVSHRYIGKVPSGVSYINLTPNKHSHFPFRITGIILSSENYGEQVQAIF